MTNTPKTMDEWAKEQYSVRMTSDLDYLIARLRESMIPTTQMRADMLRASNELERLQKEIEELKSQLALETSVW
ncbi:MAG: hypothetical protein KGL39_06485 [Patescibacteria group bacterium]|nr:hypothetical protein [Patescibacteria group bacterium]